MQKGGGILKAEFKIGEKKYVTIKVTSSGCKPFEITKAAYVLKKGDEVEESGDCEIIQKKDFSVMLQALIQPQAKNAKYTLEITYEIPPEILKYEVNIEVR